MTIPPKKILVLHEDKEERGRLGIMLARFGHEIRFSKGGGNPQNLLTDYDLVIVNDCLEGETGFDFIRQLSAEQRQKVIFITSTFWAGSVLEFQEVNVYEQILKPVDPLKLAVIVCDFFVCMEREPALEAKEV